jgi:hypothetical protein
MDELDIGGTSISKLKNMKNSNMSDDFDIDYSKILDDLDDDIMPTKNIIAHDAREDQMRSIKSKNESKKSKKNINMNSFVRNLETNIDNLSKKDTNTIQLAMDNDIVEEKSLYEQFLEFKYLDIVFSVLLFMLLNNKLTIETIYSMPYMDPNYSTFPNLLVRSILFGLSLFVVKKYVL